MNNQASKDHLENGTKYLPATHLTEGKYKELKMYKINNNPILKWANIQDSSQKKI